MTKVDRFKSERKQLVLTRSDQGDGGWSLHPPGTTEEQISRGEVPPLMTAMAEKAEESDDWDAPSASDYAIADSYCASGLRGGEAVMSEEGAVTQVVYCRPKRRQWRQFRLRSRSMGSRVFWSPGNPAQECGAHRTHWKSPSQGQPAKPSR